MRPRYFKLACLYFVLCAALGVLFTYWPPYLQTIGLSSAEIGGIVAVSLIGRTVSPYVFGWWTDRSGRIVRNMFIAALLATLFFALSLFEPAYALLALIIFVFSFFWGSLLPQVDTLIMMNLGKAPEHYSLLRLWGSVGFIVSVVGVVPILGAYGFASVPWTILALCVLSCALIPGVKGRHLEPIASAPIYKTLVRPEVSLLLLLCFLVQLSHGPYYAFFSIYLQQQGYGNLAISSMWSLGVLAEVAIFLISGRMLVATGVIKLLALSMILTAARWILTALFADQPAILAFAQLLHAFSFGVYHIAAIELIRQWFPGRLQARGQALYTSISFGLGSAIGSYVTGYFWDDLGGRIYLISAVLALICLALSGILGRLLDTRGARRTA